MNASAGEAFPLRPLHPPSSQTAPIRSSSTPTLVPESDFGVGHLQHSGRAGASRMSVRHTKIDIQDPELAATWGGVESCEARLNITPMPAFAIVQGRTRIPLAPRAVMETSFRHVREPCTWNLAFPVDHIVFEMPMTAVENWAEDRAVARGLLPEVRSGTCVTDKVLAHFALAVLPLLDGEARDCQFFVDHVLDGVCAYMFQTYASDRSLSRGGLAPWQERKTKEIMDACRGDELSLFDLASACGLSIAHFSRAFRMTCGTTPHRWLTKRRVERARDLLTSSRMPLAAIAIECGFNDQAHFTNVITKHLGSPPGALRRYWMAEMAEAESRPEAPLIMGSGCDDRTPPSSAILAGKAPNCLR